MAVEQGWQRRHPHLQLDLAQVHQLVGVPVKELELLGGGLRNTNYRVRLATSQEQSMVLRLYTADRGACARESALLQLVRTEVSRSARVARRAGRKSTVVATAVDGRSPL